MYTRFVLTLSLFEYIPLRIVRKFFFTENVLDVIGKYIPYYRVNNNRVDSSTVAEKYADIIDKIKFSKNLSILEVGVGATNATAYELIRMGYSKIVTYEPFIPFDEETDNKLLEKICSKHGLKKNEVLKNVKRVQSLDDLEKGITFDVVISNQVLEHVTKPLELFREMNSLMKDDSIQIHFVGYIDHFFKYPYHLLMFNKKTWERWLNPGNLPGWRLYDHIRIFTELGFETKVLDIQRDEKKYKEIERFVSKDYEKDNEFLDVNYCTIVVSKS